MTDHKLVKYQKKIINKYGYEAFYHVRNKNVNGLKKMYVSGGIKANPFAKMDFSDKLKKAFKYCFGECLFDEEIDDDFKKSEFMFDNFDNFIKTVSDDEPGVYFKTKYFGNSFAVGDKKITISEKVCNDDTIVIVLGESKIIISKKTAPAGEKSDREVSPRGEEQPGEKSGEEEQNEGEEEQQNEGEEQNEGEDYRKRYAKDKIHGGDEPITVCKNYKIQFEKAGEDKINTYKLHLEINGLIEGDTSFDKIMVKKIEVSSKQQYRDEVKELLESFNQDDSNRLFVVVAFGLKKGAGYDLSRDVDEINKNGKTKIYYSGDSFSGPDTPGTFKNAKCEQKMGISFFSKINTINIFTSESNNILADPTCDNYLGAVKLENDKHSIFIEGAFFNKKVENLDFLNGGLTGKIDKKSIKKMGFSDNLIKKIISRKNNMTDDGKKSLGHICVTHVINNKNGAGYEEITKISESFDNGTETENGTVFTRNDSSSE